MPNHAREELTVALTGDVMLGRGVDIALARHGPEYPWGDMLEELSSADLTLINLECVISREGEPWRRWPKVFHFHAGLAALQSLQIAGVDAVSLANNHVLDWEEEGLLEMLRHLRAAHIAFAGAGADADEASCPALLRRGGITVAVLAFTDNEPGWVAQPEAPGVNWIEISLRDASTRRVREAVAAARTAGADLVILSLHWGPNMNPRPSAEFRAFAHAAIEFGADVIHGHSAHVVQGIELYRGRPILYDTGDFVDDYVVDPELRNDWSFLFKLRVAGGAVRRVDLVPVTIGLCQVNHADERDAALINARMQALSRELGTELRQDGDRLWLDCTG